MMEAAVTQERGENFKEKGYSYGRGEKACPNLPEKTDLTKGEKTERKVFTKFMLEEKRTTEKHVKVKNRT